MRGLLGAILLPIAALGLAAFYLIFGARKLTPRVEAIGSLDELRGWITQAFSYGVDAARVEIVSPNGVLLTAFEKRIIATDEVFLDWHSPNDQGAQEVLSVWTGPLPPVAVDSNLGRRYRLPDGVSDAMRVISCLEARGVIADVLTCTAQFEGVSTTARLGWSPPRR